MIFCVVVKLNGVAWWAEVCQSIYYLENTWSWRQSSVISFEISTRSAGWTCVWINCPSVRRQVLVNRWCRTFASAKCVSCLVSTVAYHSCLIMNMHSTVIAQAKVWREEIILLVMGPHTKCIKTWPRMHQYKVKIIACDDLKIASLLFSNMSSRSGVFHQELRRHLFVGVRMGPASTMASLWDTDVIQLLHW